MGMFNQGKYINAFNKENYKVYSFRIRKEQKEMIQHLDNLKNKNSYITTLIDNDMHHPILTIKEIRLAITPILIGYGIDDIYLFGSYARGEATKDSDVDIYCNRGRVENFYDKDDLVAKLEESLGKKVDVIFQDTKLNDYFVETIKKDLIKLC